MVVTGVMEPGATTNVDGGGHTISSTMLLAELDRFLSLALTTTDKRSHSGRRDGISEGEEQTMAETALFLLRNLPPARPAALAFLAHTLSKQVSSHMRGFTSGDSTRKTDAGDDGLSGQLEGLLGELVEATPGVWGPLVSQWAVEQLGRWSVEWANTVVGRGDATLEEVVAGWLSCGPARTLAALTVACVAHDPDTAVAALLDASAASGPALDWLVAHVGCSFPARVISRVLALGLCSFASCHGRPPEHQLASVNKILSHLADRHLPDIRRGLHAILTRTFNGTTDEEVQASVPFLLCLAVTSRSRAVLAALTSGLDTLLMPGDRLGALAKQVGWWVPRYFNTHSQLQEMVVHLILDTGGAAAPSLLRLLLQGAASTPKLPPTVTAAVNSVLQGVVGEICIVTYMRRNSGSGRIHIPFLVGLRGGGLDGSDVGIAVGGRAVSPVAGLVEETLALPGTEANLIIRLLVEGVFRPECAHLFGALSHAKLEIKEVTGEKLINANRQFDTWVKAPQSHTTALTAFWNTFPLAAAKQAPEALQATRNLLEVMVTAQFLPGPLKVLPQMVEALAPYEVVCILQDVWMYMRDHTPSPDRWRELPSGYQRIPEPPMAPVYTERIKRIIQCNVDTIGHLMCAMVNADQ
ncbi:hypothetical protein C7M84_017990 [Penaeus vannamei]|uniref:Integrator complex subunit 5 n=1 Tax=Penaeus vannamei TaxID=6689 RepID=A0A423SIN0_PENVA|nr:hypothetical protein C7M84_017990 [Penaeus vannamei]